MGPRSFQAILQQAFVAQPPIQQEKLTESDLGLMYKSWRRIRISSCWKRGVILTLVAWILKKKRVQNRVHYYYHWQARSMRDV